MRTHTHTLVLSASKQQRKHSICPLKPPLVKEATAQAIPTARLVLHQRTVTRTSKQPAVSKPVQVLNGGPQPAVAHARGKNGALLPQTLPMWPWPGRLARTPPEGPCRDTSTDTSGDMAGTPAKIRYTGRDTTQRHGHHWGATHAGRQGRTPAWLWLRHRGHSRDMDTSWDTNGATGKGPSRDTDGTQAETPTRPKPGHRWIKPIQPPRHHRGNEKGAGGTGHARRGPIWMTRATSHALRA